MTGGCPNPLDGCSAQVGENLTRILSPLACASLIATTMPIPADSLLVPNHRTKPANGKTWPKSTAIQTIICNPVLLSGNFILNLSIVTY